MKSGVRMMHLENGGKVQEPETQAASRSWKRKHFPQKPPEETGLLTPWFLHI